MSPGISFLCPCRAWTGRCLLVLACIPFRLLPDVCGVPSCTTGRGRSFVLAVMQVSSPVVQNGRGRPSPAARPAGRRPYGVSLLGATARHKRSPALRVLLIVPGSSRGFFVGAGMRCWTATHACPSPLCLPLPGRRTVPGGRLTGVVVSWSFPKGIVTRQSGRRMPEDWKQAKIWGKTLRGGKPFWKKVLPPRAPPFQKLLPVGLCKDGKARGEAGPRPSRKVMSWHGKKLKLWLSGAETYGRESWSCGRPGGSVLC